MLTLMLRLARVPSFIAKLASEPDLDLELLDQVLLVLEANHQAMLAQALGQVVTALEAAGARRSGMVGVAESGGAADASTNPTKLRRQGEAKDVSDGTDASEDGEGGGSIAPSAAASALACFALPELAGPAPGSPELEQQYTAQLEEHSIGDFDSTLPRAYSRQFADKASESSGGLRMC